MGKLAGVKQTRMKKILLLLVLWCSFNVYAQDQLIQEINHLLSFVENSSCDYIRNSKHYTPKQAVAHIQKKYDYYRDDIKTTEQFIEYAASKSMLSGKRYMIRCGNNPHQSSQQWLMDELKRLRQQ
jgi:hypothetical protein